MQGSDINQNLATSIKLLFIFIVAFTQKNVELMNELVQSHHTNPSLGQEEAFVLFDGNKLKLFQHNIKIQTIHILLKSAQLVQNKFPLTLKRLAVQKLIVDTI